MKKKYILIILVVVIIFLLFLVISFTFDIQRLHHNDIFASSHSIHNFYHLQGKPATFSDVELIAGWMTFGYINKSFGLPADYLKNNLGISDLAYPRLLVSKAAAEQNTDANAYLQKVKTAVSNYLLQNQTQQKIATSSINISK
jgi:uncharacterized membrane protein YciS (DUF1049 family)